MDESYQEIFQQGMNYAIEKCAEAISKMADCKRCPVFCDWVSADTCKDHLVDYLHKYIKEEK